MTKTEHPRSFSRRSFVAGAAAVAGVGLLTACSEQSAAPSGGSSDEDLATTGGNEQILAGTCDGNCAGGCYMNIHVRDGKIVRTSARELPDPAYTHLNAAATMADSEFTKRWVSKLDLVICSDVITANNMPVDVMYNRVLTVGSDYIDCASGTYENPTLEYLPMQCQHCEEPACLQVCSTGATVKDPDTGIVTVDDELCIGCESCIKACPYEYVLLNEEAGTKPSVCYLQ